MQNIVLPNNIQKYKIYFGKLSNNINYYFESSEELSGGSKIKSILSHHEDVIQSFTDRTERFHLKLTERELINGDRFLFFNIENHTEKMQTLKFSLVLTNTKDYVAEDLSNYYRQPSYSNRYGENKLTFPSLFLSSDTADVFISKGTVYLNNNLMYEDSTKSKTKKYIYETNDIRYKQENSAVHLNILLQVPAGKNMDQFLLLSEHSLFASKQTLTSYFTDAGISVENNDVRFNMWITPEGTYTKLPYSIEPFDKDAYGVNLHHMSKKELLRYYNNEKDRFFFDLIYNAVIQVFGYRPHHKGLFLTEYTSTWLKKDFSIRAPYIDTRLNETFALVIQDSKKILPFEELNNFYLRYANFLVSYSESNSLLLVEKGAYYIPDYFALNKNASLTHSSLNHQLGIINYLFSILLKEDVSNKEAYSMVALSILKAIDLTYTFWIQDNGDLFYKISYHNNELVYSDNDYIYVTLIDLLIVQKNIIDLYGEKRKSIDTLIKSKLRYLDSQNFGLNDPHSKLPPNEDINSRSMAEKLARNLNYF